MKSDENRAENVPIVDVIASGYEWICPECEEMHEVIEFPRNPIVRCPDCGFKVELDLPEHARQ
ncbi:hypothetical protein KAR91_78660 [Candidatus Pacearchaeota archaeon]|nr:hypothetical protein [Candidatus Pacearchaeota archaeon]